ncbi:MAG: hypothetical protein AAF602_32000, partial [Myxococcota bacterium]
EHHDQRERAWFVPALEAHADPEVARAWVAEFAEAQAQLAPPEPLPLAAAPPLRFDLDALDPLDAFRIAVGRDADVASAFARVACPDHPKGPRRMTQCADLVAQIGAAPTLEARRDLLVDLAEAARLLAIVARTEIRP